MAKSTYGFSALMEAVNNSLKEDVVLDDIYNATMESASFLDIGSKFVDEDELEQDMDVDDDYISPEEDERLEKMLANIEPTDDVDSDVTESDLSSLEESLDAYLDTYDV